MRWLSPILALLLACPALAAEHVVMPGGDSLARAIAGAVPGDVLQLQDGTHAGPVTIDRPLTVTGTPGAVVDGHGQGTVITIAAPDVTSRGFLAPSSGGG